METGTHRRDCVEGERVARPKSTFYKRHVWESGLFDTRELETRLNLIIWQKQRAETVALHCVCVWRENSISANSPGTGPGLQLKKKGRGLLHYGKQVHLL